MDVQNLLERVTAIQRAHPNDDFSRMTEVLQNFAAGKTYESTIPFYDPRPAELVYPGLSTPQPWHDTSVYPWIADLEAAYSTIKEEVWAKMGDPNISNQFEDYGVEVGDTSQWKVLSFKKHFQEIPDTIADFPKTWEVLSKLPILSDCSISVLEPGGIIEPHCDHYNFTLTTHLSLSNPEDCALKVGGVTNTWEEGKCFVFDHCFEHEGWNRSDQNRVVLILNVWHFDLNEAEKAAILSVLQDFQNYYSAQRAPEAES